MKSPFYSSASLPVILLSAYVCLTCSSWGRAGPLPSSRATPKIGADSQATITIPGPLRSFLRMAAISQQVSPREVLPLLARNVAMEGYKGYRPRKGKGLQHTEYLTLLEAYVKQARELRALAGPSGIIQVLSCSQSLPLLRIIGYRLTQPCGPNVSADTGDPKKAFLADDSGFPLVDLEQTLEENKPFTYVFRSTRVPVLFSPSDWILNGRAKGGKGDVVDSLLRHPDLARLYWALSQMDANTRLVLRRSPGIRKLLPLAPVLDFYGSQIYIRSGRVVVPGGSQAETTWKTLVGASPESPSEFITRLLTKDNGWLAAYFDALARVNGTQQAYFTEPSHLRLFYAALRGKHIYPGPARPVFRPNPGLLLLVTRFQLEPGGQPRIPGNLEVWKTILSRERKSPSRTVRAWAKRARRWQSPDQLVAAMFGLSRVAVAGNPLQAFLTLSEINRHRAPGQQLSPQTAQLLADEFSGFGDQYSVFSEFYSLDDASIARFLSVAEAIDRIRDRPLRADAAGIFQANAGLWQILARQGQIPNSDWNHSWQGMIEPFSSIHSSAQLFDAARSSLRALFLASAGKPQLSQQEIVDLLAGPVQSSLQGQAVRQELADRISSALDAQRLVSLDTLFALGDGLSQMAQGRSAPPDLIQLAGDLREFQLPKPLFTPGERAEWSYGLYDNPHIQAEMATNLAKVIRSSSSPGELAASRGRLVPFLRDTLVGLNYAYYAPPGAQLLYNDPLFVRSHDFSGEAITGGHETWKTPSIFGRGQAASGGAHLIGSLADLPYVLADVEQDFIVPHHVQALIWEDLVPTLLANSVVPRWWQVSQNELHAVTLYQQLAQEVLAEATTNGQLRKQVMKILSGHLLPQTDGEVNSALGAAHETEALSYLTPADTFYLAGEFQREFPKEVGSAGKAGQELGDLSRDHPAEVNWERLSEDFGAPHPALADTYASQLLNVKPFPTFLGYSSRLLAESWESDNLYWARLADERGYSPAMLNILAPELTRRMVANIFATDLGDWPALLRALRETGDEFRQGKVVSLLSGNSAPSP